MAWQQFFRNIYISFKNKLRLFFSSCIRCVFIFGSTHQCRTHRNPTCDLGPKWERRLARKAAGHLTLRYLRADGAKSWRSRFLEGGESNEGEKAPAGGFQLRLWVLYRLHGNPSRCLIKLSPCPPPCYSILPSLRCPPPPRFHGPRNGQRRRLNVTGYKAMVTSVDFSNNLRDHPRIFVLHAVVSIYTHHCAPRRRVAMNHLIHYSGEWKIQRDVVRAQTNDVHGLLVAIAPRNEDESEFLCFHRNLSLSRDSFFSGGERMPPCLFFSTFFISWKHPSIYVIQDTRYIVVIYELEMQ